MLLFFIMFCQGLFNKVPGKGIFRRATCRSLVMVVSLDAYCYQFFAFFLHCSQLFKGGALYHGPTLGDTVEKSETDSKGLLCFWDKKLTKPEQI